MENGKLKSRIVVVVSRIFALALWTATSAALAAQAKPTWQVEWEKVVEAGKKEGQVAVYISGYEEILPEFQKDYPEIKVLATTGSASEREGAL